MNVLAIGAHPDDLEFGCAGTLIRHVNEGGDRVFLAVVTDGASSGEAEIRRQEQLNAAKLIGAEEVFFSVILIPSLSAIANRLCGSRR